MFGIEWLREGSVVERETSPANTRSEAVESARARAHEVVARLPGREPDSFKLRDGSGKEIGIFPLTPHSGAFNED
jgi:hypothetical protein